MYGANTKVKPNTHTPYAQNHKVNTEIVLNVNFVKITKN